VFTITRSGGDVTVPLTVKYSVIASAESFDYLETLTGTVTIAANQQSATITITPVDDTEVEGLESIYLVLNSDQEYGIGDDESALVTIGDNDSGGGGEAPAVDIDIDGFQDDEKIEDVLGGLVERHF
jgi:hypothetical protein